MLENAKENESGKRTKNFEVIYRRQEVHWRRSRWNWRRYERKEMLGEAGGSRKRMTHVAHKSMGFVR